MNDWNYERRVVSTYHSWVHMINRCTNSNDRKYKDYGARGIGVDEKWATFEGFLEDMGVKPVLSYKIDRRNNDGHYTKNNCRWADDVLQNLNKRRYRNNTTGIKGVVWHKNERYKQGGFWEAQVFMDKICYKLYQGPDFFEACCAKKHWENENASYFR